MTTPSTKNKKKTPKPKVKSRSNTLFIIGAIAGLLLAVVLVAAFIKYGSIHGALLDSKSFPGADAPALAEGRAKVDASINEATATLRNLPKVNLSYASPLQKADSCVKGEHKPPVAGATEDNYAYWCEISAQQYFGYANDMCQILAALVDARISLYTQTTQDCRAQIPGLQAGSGNYYYTSPDHEQDQVKVASAADFTSALTSELSSPGLTYTLTYDHCNQTIGRQQVYCKQQNNSKDEVARTVNAIPVDVMTIVTYEKSQSTYYQK